MRIGAERGNFARKTPLRAMSAPCFAAKSSLFCLQNPYFDKNLNNNSPISYSAFLLLPPCECPTKKLCIFVGTLFGGIRGGLLKFGLRFDNNPSVTS